MWSWNDTIQPLQSAWQGGHINRCCSSLYSCQQMWIRWTKGWVNPWQLMYSIIADKVRKQCLQKRDMTLKYYCWCVPNGWNGRLSDHRAVKNDSKKGGVHNINQKPANPHNRVITHTAGTVVVPMGYSTTKSMSSFWKKCDGCSIIHHFRKVCPKTIMQI